MARLPTDYNLIETETKPDLSAQDFLVIETKAKALDLDQCLDILGIEKQTLSQQDLSLAERAHKRGRAEAIANAADKLFTSMSHKNGGVPAIDYLRQMSGSFKAEVQSTGGNGFKFNVVLND